MKANARRTPFEAASPDLSFDEPLPALDFDAPPAGAVGRRLGIRAARLTRRPSRRRCANLLDAGQLEAAKKLLCPLPVPNETVHCLLAGNFTLAQAVPVMLDETGPTALLVSTLGINDATVDLLCEEMKRGRITALDVLLSHYFQQADAATCLRVAARLKAHRARAGVARVHCKLILSAPSNRADRYTLEGSANLRSSQNIEQLAVSNSAELHRFYSEPLRQILDRNRL